MAVTASEINTTIGKVKSMQSKWGLSQTGMSVSSGSTMRASEINSIIDMINQGKSKSGWTGSVSSKVNVGEVIRNILASLNSQADAITSHCPCNCNHCSCNCNHCPCNCDRCYNCGSNCDSRN